MHPLIIAILELLARRAALVAAVARIDADLARLRVMQLRVPQGE